MPGPPLGGATAQAYEQFPGDDHRRGRLDVRPGWHGGSVREQRYLHVPSGPDGPIRFLEHPVVDRAGRGNRAPSANAGPDQSICGVGTLSRSTAAPRAIPTVTPSIRMDADAAPGGEHRQHFQRRPLQTPRLYPTRRARMSAQLVVNDGTLPSPAGFNDDHGRQHRSGRQRRPGSDEAPVTTTATLTGAGSSDVDGDPLTFAWQFQSVPNGSTAVLQRRDHRQSDVRRGRRRHLHGQADRERRHSRQRRGPRRHRHPELCAGRQCGRRSDRARRPDGHAQRQRLQRRRRQSPDLRLEHSASGPPGARRP